MKEADSEKNHLNKIDLVERLIASRLLDIENRDYVLMVEVSQELHFTQSSQTKHGMIKRGNLFDGHLLSGGLVNGRAGHPD